jgi:hypothetical protein
MNTLQYSSPAGTISSAAEGWSVPNASIEANWLYAMVVRQVETVESIAELIAVPPHIESALQEYARRNPDEAGRIDRVLHFRRQVQDRFNRLAAHTPSTTG